MLLDDADKELITELYSNFRDPVTTLAEKTGLSVDKARYRMQKYEDKGLIQQYNPILNHSRLGYNFVAIGWLRNTSLSEVSSHRHVLTAASCVTSYDVTGHFVFKSIQDLREGFSGFDADVFLISSGELYPLKNFDDSRRESFSIEPAEDQVSLDDVDRTVLRCLDEDGRMKAVDIADRVGLSSEAVLYRIRKLREDDVLQGLRAQFDYTVLGLNVVVVMFDIDGDPGGFHEVCRQHPAVNVASLGVGPHDAYVQLMYEDMRELRDVCDVLRERCGATKVSMVPLSDEMAARGLPPAAYQ
jgi:Lrp/AsnC family leucine-responsive transcriptional regulator